MREIEFRGKRVDNGEWIYGYLYIHEGISEIPYWIRNNSVLDKKVIPETVGQYTGLTDKNGKKIFEGDIVLIGERRRPVEIVFKNGRFGYLCNDTCITVQYKNPEVIGNIFDKEGNDGKVN